MKKSDEACNYKGYDLTVPRRQSYAAILLIAYRLYKLLIRQLFPFLLIAVFGGTFKKEGTFMYGLLGLTLLGAIYSIISFFKYYFHLKDDKLIVQKGVFKRSFLEIPFDRIQSINFEQNLIHRVFNVVKLNMDTAGSDSSELQLNALNHDLASAISEYILKHKEVHLPTSQDSESDVNQYLQKKKVIFNLTIPQLLKVGVTENHLRSGGLIIFFFLWIGENLRDIGLDYEEKMGDYIPDAEALSRNLIIIALVTILFMVVSFLISLIRTVLKHFNLTMHRLGDGFVIESGLFNRKEHAAKDHKIQLISWSQNLLQNWAKIYELRMKQASSVQVSDKKSIVVAGLDKDNLSQTEVYLFKGYTPELTSMAYHNVHPYFRFKKLYYRSLFLLPIIGGLIYVDKIEMAITVGILYLISICGAQLSYTKKKFGYSDNLFVLRGGTFGHSATMMLLHKIQNLSQTQTPFQKRRDIKSLILHTASGSIRIPDIPTAQCEDLSDYLLYKVESSEKGWM